MTAAHTATMRGERPASPPHPVRDTLLCVVGWVAGAAMILLFAKGGPAVEDAGLLLAAIALGLGVFFVGPLVIERRGPRWPQLEWQPYTVAAGINALIGCLAVPQLGRATGWLRDATAIEVWLGFGGVGLLQLALHALLARAPAFRERVGSRAPILVGPVLVIVPLVAAVALILEANRIVATGSVIERVCVDMPRDFCADIQPTLPVLPFEAQLFVGIAAVAALAARLVDWQRASAVLMAVVFAALVFWAAEVWDAVRWQGIELGGATSDLARLQVASGVLILLAIIAGSAFPRWPLLPESWRLAPVDEAASTTREPAGARGR